MFPPLVLPDIRSDNKTGTKEVDVSSAILKNTEHHYLLCLCEPSFKVSPLYSNESYLNSIFSIAAVIDDPSKEVGFGSEYYADLVFRTSQYR